MTFLRGVIEANALLVVDIDYLGCSDMFMHIEKKLGREIRD